MLESEEYAISQKSLTISRIIPKTDIEEFKQQFNLEKEKVHVYAKNGTTEMKNGVIGTGMKIRFDNIENEYTACVIGDINSDGEISQYEISKAIKHVVGLEAHQLSGINATAIDVDGDGEITQKDVSILIKYVVYGKLDIDGKKTPTAPIISVLSGEQGKNNWYTSGVELQINKPEKSPVKIEYMMLEITGTENIQEIQIDDAKKITIQQDGTYEVKAYSVSVIGTKSEIATLTVKINKTPPINAEIVATLGSEDGTEYIFGETAKQNIYVKERDKIGNKVTIEAQGANELKAGTSLPIVLENEGKTKLIVSTENEAGLVTKREYTAIIDKQIKRPGSLTLKLNDANGNEYKSNTWTNQNVYMEVAQGGQNIVTTFKVDGTVAIEERSEPLTITQEGLYTITVINRDDVGNESQSSLRVKIDKTAPVAPVLQIVKGEKDNEDNEWYKGDAWYGDGAELHLDYYNSLVIHPMLTDVLSVMKKHGLERAEFLERQLVRQQRMAAQLERMISPEATYPVVGRSIVYRFGVFHALSQIALLDKIPQPLSKGQIRSALTAVMQRQISMPGTFDENGWLKIGFSGSQINMSEPYINTGSLYMCTAVFLPLGLPANHPFWTEPYSEWTNLKAWKGVDVGADKALRKG